MGREPLKIVFVEDDKPTVEEFLDYFATLDDYKIVGVANGVTKAIEIIKAEQPSVVLLDVTLQEGSGVMLEKKLRDREFLSYIPCVLAVTAMKLPMLNDALSAGCVREIFKKYDSNYSVKKVADWLVAHYDELPHANMEVETVCQENDYMF